VKFHTDLWVAVAASAPVIALAAVVSLEGTLELSSTLLSGKRRLRRKYARLANTEMAVQRGRWTIRLGILLSITNLWLQGATLTAALVSLGLGRDELPPVLVAAAEGAGLVALVCASVLKVWSNELALRIDEDLARPLPRADWPGQARIPSGSP
jgi:uncharacterized membrane protein YbhN (UPF0104 family)